MKTTSILLLTAVAGFGLAAATLQAQTLYLRSSANSWGMTPLPDLGGGVFGATLTGGTPGATVQFKIATDTWSPNYPGDGQGDVFTVFDANGNFSARWIPSPASDGWSPVANRVGYVDPAQHGWEIMGAFNGWSAPVIALAAQGNGLYAGEYLVAAPGSYEFKFRKPGDWGTSIGANFGTWAPNAQVTTAAPGQTVRFELDLPNGRWQTSVVPEPSSVALFGLGLLALRALRSRRA